MIPPPPEQLRQLSEQSQAGFAQRLQLANQFQSSRELDAGSLCLTRFHCF
jgi:hypothetical protein